MTEDAATAGALLRAARERRNMTLAALALSIKVSPRKLDALERDALDELPDTTFARALAQSVCRQLRIDAKPVLALLPAAPAWANSRFEQIVRGSRLQLTEARRPSESSSRGGLRPVFWLAGLLMLGAVALLYGRPDDLARWWASVMPAPPAATAPAATPVAARTAEVMPPPAAASALPVDTPAAAAPADASASAAAPAAPADPAVVIETVHSAPTGQLAAASGAEPAGALVLRADAESWVEVRDAAGQLLLSRTLLAGEAVGVDGATPLRAVIGNAGATNVSFRGAAVDLTAVTRDNIARLELK
jgi:cytoskeleton protein RodZ